MRLPDRITPDPIKDSIIQLQFTSAMPLEILIGECSKLLHEHGWRYQTRLPLKPMQHGIQVQIGGDQPQHYFIQDSIRIQIQNARTLFFNINDRYPGWTTYSALVYQVIGLLYNQKIIISVTRIGMRYISQFPNINMADNLNLKLSQPEGLGSLQQSVHRLSFREDKMIKTINIANNVMTAPGILVNQQQLQPATMASMIDIDIVDTGLPLTSPEEFKEKLDTIHTKEKEVFFSLITEPFLETLNPEYS